MDSDQTTASGGGLTLITGPGGYPVDRRTADEWCVRRLKVQAPDQSSVRNN